MIASPRSEGTEEPRPAQVSFWQLAKDDVGHVDPASVDFVVGDNLGDSHTLIDWMRGHRWFN